MTRALLLLLPPLATAQGDTAALAALAELARAVRALREAGRDVRLRVCRGGSAAEEAAKLRGGDATLLVLSLGAPERDIAAQALHDALGDAAASPMPLASADLAAWGRLATQAGAAQPRDDAIDFGLVAAPNAPTLRQHADAALRRAQVALLAEMFAGNHVAARNAALLENIVP